MINKTFTSNAEAIKFFAKEMLADGQAHTVAEIKSYVRENYAKGIVFTDGMYAGAIRSLVQSSSGRYRNVERGTYQCVEMQQQEDGRENSDAFLCQNVLEALEAGCSALETACTMPIFGLSSYKTQIAKKVEAILQEMRRTAEEIREL